MSIVKPQNSTSELQLNISDVILHMLQENISTVKNTLCPSNITNPGMATFHNLTFSYSCLNIMTYSYPEYHWNFNFFFFFLKTLLQTKYLSEGKLFFGNNNLQTTCNKANQKKRKSWHLGNMVMLKAV